MNPFTATNLEPILRGRRVFVGVTGSIAAFKVHDLVRGLRKCGAEVQVALTESASKFITPLTLETLSGRAVHTSLWNDGHGTHHIDVARWAEVFVVAPATAHTLARMAQGLADDVITTEYLAFKGPVLVAPAMNPAMWEHPATRRNVETLRKDGVRVIGPGAGIMACGEEGEGRMVEPEPLVEAVASALYSAPNGKRALVSLGPTRSALDPVRYLTNRSSGRMGAAVAWALRQAGYDVTAVCGPMDPAVTLPYDCKRIDVRTTSEMAQAVAHEWPLYSVFVSSAAVLDFEFAATHEHKLKKEAGGIPQLDLRQTQDILKAACEAKKAGQIVVGFAAETRDAVAAARKKREAKGCDAVFVNDVSVPGTGFESEQNAGWWVTAKGEVEFKRADKAAIARQIVASIASLGDR
jgi:phosphopantothenoylcysteine decarboxylase/phosphopantothenate--cysteine ligase